MRSNRAIGLVIRSIGDDEQGRFVQSGDEVGGGCGGRPIHDYRGAARAFEHVSIT
jgi:hypothetical protein